MKRKCERVEELRELIDKGHNYRFIGKVGRFCPIKPGCGGGLLMRERKTVSIMPLPEIERATDGWNRKWLKN